MKPRKLSEWRKEGLPKREICHLFGFDKLPVKWKGVEEPMSIETVACHKCDPELKKECDVWSHYWAFFPLYLEEEKTELVESV